MHELGPASGGVKLELQDRAGRRLANVLGFAFATSSSGSSTGDDDDIIKLMNEEEMSL